MVNAFVCKNQKICTEYGISLAANSIFEVYKWYGHESVCELQAWRQSLVFSGANLAMCESVGQTKGYCTDQYDLMINA